MVRLWHIPAMIALVAALHFGAVWSGFYDRQFSTRVFWFDNVLHGLVGIGVAMGALYILEHGPIRLPFMGGLLFVLAVVALGAVTWELVEYVFFTQFTEYAYWSRIYSPSITEALSDIVSNLIGAGVFLSAFWRKVSQSLA